MYKERIREFYEYLSPGYQRIADYLLNHYREAAFMRAAEIAKAAHVDVTSVVRFAQRLGYPGYPELSTDVQAEVKQDLRAVYQPLPEGSSPATVFRRSLIEDRNNLDYVLLHTEDQDIQVVLDILDAAPRIYVLGEGPGLYAAEMFTLRMLAFGYNIRTVLSDANSRIALISTIQPGDALVALGLLELSPTMTSLVKLARDEGAHTMTITSSPAAPTASAADHVLHAPAQGEGFLPSMTAVIAVLHALLQALVARKGDGATDWVLHYEQLYRRYAKFMGEPFPPLEGLGVLARQLATGQSPDSRSEAS